MVLSRRASPAEPIALQSERLLNDSDSDNDDNAKAQRSKRILTWDELPVWMRDNHYIRTGYRAPTNSFVRCFQSIFYLHNETGNITSHLLGALGFLGLCYTVTQNVFPQFATVDWQDIITMYVFLLGAVGCMGLSAMFHTVSCHSHGVQRMYNKCDYVGIVFLIVGSCVPVFCYTFYCHPRLKLFYLGLIFTLGAITIVMVVAPKFGTSEYRPLRAVTFVLLGLSGVLPATHAVIMFGWEYALNAVQIPYMLAMGGFYIAGATLYGARIPERWFPGKCDYWLHSHQIFHVFVVVAAIFHYVGVVRALRWTHTEGRGLCGIAP